MLGKESLKELGDNLQFQDKTLRITVEPEFSDVVIEKPDGTVEPLAFYTEPDALLSGEEREAAQKARQGVADELRGAGIEKGAFNDTSKIGNQANSFLANFSEIPDSPYTQKISYSQYALENPQAIEDNPKLLNKAQHVKHARKNYDNIIDNASEGTIAPKNGGNIFVSAEIEAVEITQPAMAAMTNFSDYGGTFNIKLSDVRDEPLTLTLPQNHLQHLRGGLKELSYTENSTMHLLIGRPGYDDGTGNVEIYIHNADGGSLPNIDLQIGEKTIEFRRDSNKTYNDYTDEINAAINAGMDGAPQRHR